MAVLLQSLRYIDAEGVQTPKDYLYTGEEVIPYSADSISKIDQKLDCSSFYASKGWVDLRCMAGEPGEEYRETLQSLGEVLAHSGFTKAVLLPNTTPAVQTKNDLEFLLSKTKNWVSDFEVQAAVTKECKGEDFTDILDLHDAGAKVFGDGIKPLANPDRLLRILQYLQKFGGILFDQSYDPLLAIFGQMHEGEVSTRMGMKGIPNLAEDTAIQRNLEILRYAGGSMHFQTISTKGAVEKIREAKSQGLAVSADVSLYQLIFSDADLEQFDANYKVMPPFRSEEDRNELIKGLKDGTIDALVSNHQPQDSDAKNMEFDLAAFGMIGLQTFLPGMVKLADELGWPLLIEKITSGPKKVLKEDLSGNMDTLTIFDPNEEWTFDSRTNKSLSANHPWFGQPLKGRVKMMINRDKFFKL